jgi:hypothetical protein
MDFPESRKEPVRSEELSDTSGTICLVPEDVPVEVMRCLEHHFAVSGVVIRITRGRRGDRRAGRDRRADAIAAKLAMERRFEPELEARRFTERRGGFERVEAPDLPAPALPYAERLRFVRRRPRPVDDGELTRLRQMAVAWRERAREHDREAHGLLSSLVGVVDDLRQLRALTPRWFLAVRRGEQAIERFRQRHVTR